MISFLLAIFIPLGVIIIGFTVGSMKIITQGNEALVESLGKYKRKLKPGVNFIIPLLENIVIEETIRERFSNIPTQQAITADKIYVEMDTVIYWQIFNLHNAFYNIDNLEEAMKNLVLTNIRAIISQMKLEDILSSANQINRVLLQVLDQATGPWGIKVIRVEFKNISPPKTVLESLKMERSAEIRKRAEILAAESTVESVKKIAQALQSHPNSKEALQYLIAQKYVEATQKLGESPNSKIIFMDPKSLSDVVENLIDSFPNIPNPNSSNIPPNGSNLPNNPPSNP